MTIPRRIEPLSFSLKRLRASMKMSNFQRKYAPEYRHMTSIRKTKSTSEKGLLRVLLDKREILGGQLLKFTFVLS